MYTLGQVIAVIIISFIGGLVTFMVGLVCIAEWHMMRHDKHEEFPDKEDWKGLL